MSVPAEFSPHFRKSKFTEPWEPLYSSITEDQVKIGVTLMEAHCNSRGMVHGAFLAAIADNAIGLTLGYKLKSMGRPYASGLVTVSLSIDYLSKASVGEWIETDTQIDKLGKTLCFATLKIRNDNECVAQVRATFTTPTS